MDDLVDVEVDLLARAHLELVLEPLHLGALAPDDDARARGEDRDPRAVARALDVDLRDARVIELILDVAADLHVLVEELRVVLGSEPPRAPGPGGPEAKADGVRLLTHAQFFSLPVRAFAAALPPRRAGRSAGGASLVAAAAARVASRRDLR